MSSPQVLAITARTVSLLVPSQGAKYSLKVPITWSLTTDQAKEAQTGVTLSVAVFLEALEPDRSYVFNTPNGSIRFRTKPCTGLVDAREYGADPLSTDNQTALQTAVDAVPKGGTLRVPAGSYRTGPLFLKAEITLLLEDGAVLAAIGVRAHWPILEAYEDTGRVIGTWEGLPERCFAALITGIDCHGAHITGKGMLDGGGDRGDWWSWPKETRNGARRPRTLHLLYSDAVSITGVTLCNSPSWTLHPYRCTGLHVSNLFVQNPSESPNTDGLDPESCEHVDIIATSFSVGDDCIAIKAGKRTDDGDASHLAPTRDIRIQHCRMERGHGAVVLGSEMSGDITDVSIAQCEFDATDRGLRIKTRRGRGGVVARIAMRDVIMHRVPTPLAANAFYFCDHDGKSDAVQSRIPAPVDETTPRISDISITGVRAMDAEIAAVAVLGLPEAPILDVTIENLDVSFARDAVCDVPLMALHVPKLRHAPLYSEFADVTGAATLIPPNQETQSC